MDLNKRKSQIREKVLAKHDKATKIGYLKGIGLFDANALLEMEESQINELVDSAMQVKGF